MDAAGHLGNSGDNFPRWVGEFDSWERGVALNTCVDLSAIATMHHYDVK